jgi:uncharacterized membrane protein YtjA (UPF0391 family)
MHLQHSLEQLVGKHNSYLNIIKELHMLHYSVVIALIAAVFGFGGIAAGAEEIAKILFFIFAAMAIIGFIVSLMKKK